jgi:biotin transport system substrate-specific component
MVLASIFSALTAVCAWIAVPIPPVSFTLQTFAILMALGILGGKWGSVSIFLYLAMGIIGLPVFSGFRGGAAALLDPTGGFLWGFLLAGLGYWLLERLGKLPAMIAAMLVTYACGCRWFTLYAGNAPWHTALLTCVAPYLIPDAVKLWLAYTLSRRIEKYVRK